MLCYSTVSDCHFSVCLQAVRATTGDPIAVIGVSARTGLSVTPSQVRVSAPTGTRDGDVRSPVSVVIMARRANYPASVSMVPPATTRPESASVHRATPELCEYRQTYLFRCNFLFGVPENMCRLLCV